MYLWSGEHLLYTVNHLYSSRAISSSLKLQCAADGTKKTHKPHNYRAADYSSRQLVFHHKLMLCRLDSDLHRTLLVFIQVQPPQARCEGFTLVMLHDFHQQQTQIEAASTFLTQEHLSGWFGLNISSISLYVLYVYWHNLEVKQGLGHVPIIPLDLIVMRSNFLQYILKYKTAHSHIAPF